MLYHSMLEFIYKTSLLLMSFRKVRWWAQHTFGGFDAAHFWGGRRGTLWGVYVKLQQSQATIY